MASADVAGASAKLTLSSAIHQLQISLLDYGPCTDSQLFAAGALLSRPDYEDVVVERSIADLCGYPTCPNPLPADRPRHGRYRISLREHKVYDLEETYRFCGESCVVGSRAFSGSLAQERRMSVSPARLAEVLRLFEDLSLKGLRRPTVGDAEDGDFGFSKLTIREKNRVAAGEVTAEEWIGPSNAIEGYVPQTERNQGAAGKRRTRTKSKENSQPAKDGASDDKKERDFASTIGATDPVSSVPHGLSSSSASSMVTSNCLERGIQRIEEGSLVDKVKVMEPPFLKPSLKTSGEKARNRTVKWADEEKLGALVEIEGSVKSVDDKQNKARSASVDEEDDDSSLRFASAEACVAALSHASESVTSGESEPGDAATEAGIVILPPSFDTEGMNSEAEEDTFVFDNGFLKWPKKTVLLDTDMFEVEDSWHDTPPEGFSLTLSPFTTMWNALFCWITCSSLAFIYGREEGSLNEFLCVNGREYPRKIVLSDGRSSKIMQTMAGCIARVLPQLVTDLHIRTPVSSIEKAMAHLLETMTFADALPAFKIKQWRAVVLLFIDGLSVHRIPSITPQMTSCSLWLEKVLRPAQITWEEYESMKDLVLPLGRGA